MARKRVIEPPSIKSWEDANEALRQIAEATIALADIEGEMNKQILGAKKAAEEQSKPFKDRVAKLERELKDFVTENRSDMGKAKSKTLTFGEVSFRLSTSISLPRAKEKLEEIIRRLKARQMTDSPTGSSSRRRSRRSSPSSTAAPRPPSSPARRGRRQSWAGPRPQRRRWRRSA